MSPTMLATNLRLRTVDAQLHNQLWRHTTNFRVRGRGFINVVKRLRSRCFFADEHDVGFREPAHDGALRDELGL